jgi:hypothetical protein
MQQMNHSWCVRLTTNAVKFAKAKFVYVQKAVVVKHYNITHFCQSCNWCRKIQLHSLMNNSFIKFRKILCQLHASVFLLGIVLTIVDVVEIYQLWKETFLLNNKHNYD